MDRTFSRGMCVGMVIRDVYMSIAHFPLEHLLEWFTGISSLRFTRNGPLSATPGLFHVLRVVDAGYGNGQDTPIRKSAGQHQ